MKLACKGLGEVRPGVHVQTLKLCVEQANKYEAEVLAKERAEQVRQDAARREHQRQVDEIAERITFDDDG